MPPQRLSNSATGCYDRPSAPLNSVAHYIPMTLAGMLRELRLLSLPKTPSALILQDFAFGGSHTTSVRLLDLSVPKTPSALILNDFDLCGAHLGILK